MFTGRKAEKKKAKNPHEQELNARQRNPKAFAIQSVAKAQKRFHRYESGLRAIQATFLLYLYMIIFLLSMPPSCRLKASVNY